MKSKDYPLAAPPQDQLRFMVSYAVLAPSGHNTQPWLFRLGDDYLDLLADRTRALPVVDPHDREMIISCGAALDHMRVTARHFGIELAIAERPVRVDADLLARIRIAGVHTPDSFDHDLFEAIPQRRTTREVFEQKILPTDVRRLSQALAEQAGVTLTMLDDESHRSKVAALVAEGDRIQFADPRFRRELAAWVHSRRADTHDGMSGSGFGMPDVLSPVGAMAIRTFNMGNGVAASDLKKIVQGSPILAVFSTDTDTPSDWLATGRALSQVLLSLTVEGATASYLNPPIELDELRPRLAKALDIDAVPQLLMRFGYGPKGRASVRRSLNEVLI